MLRGIAIGLLCSVLSITAFADGPSTYHISQTFKIAGDGRWDYVIVDPESGHLFVPRSTHVQVINTADGTVIGDIPDTQGVHGVALVPELKRAFASDGKANGVTIFDTDSLKTIGTVPTGNGPDGIIYDPFSKRVFCMNGRDGSVSAISADEQVAQPGVVTVPLDGKPEFAASDGAGNVYVNLEDKGEVEAIDSKQVKVLKHWSLAPGEDPTGIAIDPQTHRLFIGCHNNLMVVMNADTGKVVATFPIGSGVDACAFDPGTKLAFASCGDSTLTAIHEDDADHFTALPTIHTERGARTMALDVKTHTIFMPTADFKPTTQSERRPPMVDGSFKILVVTP